MQTLVGDTLYFSANDGSSGTELWAHDTSNASTWRVADIYSGSSDSAPGHYMEILVGDTLYFSADDGSSGTELWAHDTSNASTWRVADIWSGTGNSDPGNYGMEILVGDTLYFNAHDGSSGIELWAHDTSNSSTWRVADIDNGHGNSLPGQFMEFLIGDTLYFSAKDVSSGFELWAHDTSNASTWQVADLRPTFASSNPGEYLHLLVGDTLYFSAHDGSSAQELWAHDTSNASTWQVADINSGTGGSSPGTYMEMLVGDTLYFSAYDGSSGTELWAHHGHHLHRLGQQHRWLNLSNSNHHHQRWSTRSVRIQSQRTTRWTNNTEVHLAPQFINQTTGNGSTWLVADIYNGGGGSYPGREMAILVGDTMYFECV
jgi:ELWxxDGT repeat protein